MQQHACSCTCLRHVTNLGPNVLPLYTALPLQVFLQCSQAPFRTHPITVSILVGNKAWLVLVDAVVGHVHTPPPAQQVSGPPQGFHQMDRHDRCMQCWRITASAVSPPVYSILQQLVASHHGQEECTKSLRESWLKLVATK